MKKCIRCGSEKALDEFYKHPEMADGHLGKCKACARADVTANRSLRVDYYRQYDRDRNMEPQRVTTRKKYLKTDAGKAARRVALANYAVNHGHKKRATIMVNNAVRDKRLVKGPCEVCGVKKVEGHHPDYSKPLEVRWLCNKHHREIHDAGKEV